VRFGATFLANPPAARLVELAVAAEAAGFDSVWLNDCDTLFEDPWPVFALIARETTKVKIGPCVTNPSNRDWSVTAGLLATLHDISGGRMVCGIGRGDAAVRMLGQRPASPRQLEAAIVAIRDLVAGRPATIDGNDVRLAWAPGFELEMWGAGYGPAVLDVVGRCCDGFILQAADVAILEWTRGRRRRPGSRRRADDGGRSRLRG
jgi:alkanesulfonate monooxygenase SsuD/methylene tetrahydromethanopterin reductase-like flavin-dependent oxidoreductase (luciferase family)